MLPDMIYDVHCFFMSVCLFSPAFSDLMILILYSQSCVDDLFVMFFLSSLRLSRGIPGVSGLLFILTLLMSRTLTYGS